MEIQIENPTTSSTTIDENLYSRSICTYGIETVIKLAKLKIFLCGLRGVGIETAKNIIQNGPAQLCLHDEDLVEMKDMGCNPFLKPEDVNQISRADACCSQLQELNSYCKVSVHKGKLIENQDNIINNLSFKILDDYDVIVITDNYNSDLISQINNYCRAQNKGFIYSGNLGLYGFCFVDFGENHQVTDENDEEIKSYVVVNITQSEEPVVQLDETFSQRMFQSNDEFITFRDVQGMTELNGQILKMEKLTAYSFKIIGVDTRSYSPFHTSGYVEPVKMPKNISFNSFSYCLQNPLLQDIQQFEILDWNKFGVPEQLHIILQGIFSYVKNNGNLPNLNSESDANDVIQIIKTMNFDNYKIGGDSYQKIIENLNDDLIKNVCFYSRAQISPVVTFWGGIVSSEIIKYTGKYTPLRQWLHHEFFELLPLQSSIQDRTIISPSRYDDYISIFGHSFQEKIANQKTFIIGAGAIGCEHAKMFALMGLGLKQNKQSGIIITDNDQVELSNLNSSFLFKKQNIFKSKAECVQNQVQSINSDIQISYLNERVQSNSENIFDEELWESLNFVVSAVDNLQSKLYIDKRCVWYEKPLFECGIQGTKCNSSTIIPYQTQSYSDIKINEENLCFHQIVPNFPFQIDHTILWAVDQFSSTFTDELDEYKKYLENPKIQLDKLIKEWGFSSPTLLYKLQYIKLLSEVYLSRGYEKCIEIARHLFENKFYTKIQDLLNKLPADYLNNFGQKFWEGNKRLPTPITYNKDDPIHFEFILSTTNIFAFIFGIQPSTDIQFIKNIIDSIKPSNYHFIFTSQQQTQTEDKIQDQTEQQKNQIIIDNLIQELSSIEPSEIGFNQAWNLNEVNLKIEDPNNYHLDFISSNTNIRARNYRIKEADKFYIKCKAGKITGAVASTVSTIVGAVGLEIIKYIIQKPILFWNNSFGNLSMPMFIFSETQSPIMNKDAEFDAFICGPVKVMPKEYSKWDKLLIDGPLTIQNFIDLFAQKYNVKVSMISYDTILLYNSFITQKDKLQYEISELVQEKQKQQIFPNKKYLELEICCENDEGIDVNFPTIKYRRIQ